MSINLALNKPTMASSFVKPFQPSRAVDGNNNPEFRWVCNIIPGWLSVDLGREYYIDRWVVVHMQSAGWNQSYNLIDFLFQGSVDNVNWVTLDNVTNNQVATTDRNIPVSKVRYVRVYVNKGLGINPRLASIMDFQVYECISPYLSNITLDRGQLNPSFNKSILNYEATVTAQNITVTPWAENPQSVIKVNNRVVMSGQPSQSINLNTGVNIISVIATSIDNISNVNYTINVINTASTANLIRVDFAYKGRTGKVITEVNINDNQVEYTIDLPDTVKSVTITPYAQDISASIIINNNQILKSGQESSEISVEKYKKIPIQVKISNTFISKEYSMTIV